MSLKFNPPKTVGRYAVFVDYGNDREFFKLYDELGSAKSAHRHKNYGIRNDAKILENVDGEWYTLYDIKAGTSDDNLPWKKKRTSWYYRESGHKVAKPMTRDEYAEWRLAVERERVAESKHSLSEALTAINR